MIKRTDDDPRTEAQKVADEEVREHVERTGRLPGEEVWEHGKEHHGKTIVNRLDWPLMLAPWTDDPVLPSIIRVLEKVPGETYEGGLMNIDLELREYVKLSALPEELQAQVKAALERGTNEEIPSG